MTNMTATIGCTYLGAGGTAIGGVVGDWTRRFDLYDSGTVPYVQHSTPHILPVGDQQTADSRPQSSMLDFVVASTSTHVAVGTDDMEALALDEWRALNTLFLPYTGRQFLKVHRHNHAAGDVDSVSLVEVVELPGARIGNPGVGQTWLEGLIRYPVKMYKPFPFWWNATVTSTDTANVDAAEVTTNVTVPVGSVGRIGARIVYKTVTGASTRWLFQNHTTGDEMTVLSSDTPHNADYVDLFHADKLGNANPLAGMTHSSTFAQNAASENKASFWLVPGVNEIAITKIAGAGSCTFSIVFQELWGSI